MNYHKANEVILLFVFLLPLLLCGCSVSSEDNSEEQRINESIPNANGMYFPERCSDQGDTIELLGRLDLPKPLTDVWGYYDSETKKEYAVIGFQKTEKNNGGLYIVDVTDPADLSLSATLEYGEVNDVAVWKDYAYSVTGHSEDGEMGSIYDISDPVNPLKAGEFPSGHNLFITDKGYLNIADPGVKKYNLLPDPTNPELIWNSVRAEGHDVAVIDNILLDFHGFDGTLIFDNTNPHEPEFLKNLDNESVRFHHSGWTSRDREYLYINDELPANYNQRNDISVWNLETNKMVGSYRDTTSTVHNSYTVCDQLVVSYYVKGLVLFDISDPSQLVLLDEYKTDSEVEGEGWFLGAWGVFPYTHSGNLLVSDVNKGLYVFQLR